jgi:hypothetical protein
MTLNSLRGHQISEAIVSSSVMSYLALLVLRRNIQVDDRVQINLTNQELGLPELTNASADSLTVSIRYNREKVDSASIQYVLVPLKCHKTLQTNSKLVR